MKRLLDSGTINSDQTITLVFKKKISLSSVETPGYDRLDAVKKGSVSYIIGSIVPSPAGDTESRIWIVSYTGTSMKKKKGTVIDPEEVVVVIETKEELGGISSSSKATGGKKSATKKQTKKKVTKPAALKKNSKKK